VLTFFRDHENNDLHCQARRTLSILCGTDFTAGSREAVRVAAALSKRRDEPLRLVHAFDPPMAPGWDDDLQTRARAAAVRQLAKEAGEARGLGSPTVEESIAEGAPDEVLVSEAAVRKAGLVVLGAVGRRAGPAWSLGGTAKRVAAAAKSPVLLVRSALPIEAWLGGERPLKVVVGDDLTPASDAALRWAADLRRLGPCEIVACHVFSLLGENSRLGAGDSLYARVPELEQANLADLQRHAGPSLGAEGVRYRVEGTLGRAAEPLLDIAAEEAADLLIVGTGQRTALGRARHGWSSQIALSDARSNVACIPAGVIPAAEPRFVPPLRRVLVATDFSPVGNQAVAYAYAIVADGGTVHILHVEEPERTTATTKDLAHAAAVERLRPLIPEAVPGKNVETRLEFSSDSNVAAAIASAGERLDVDVVCMGTHGRSGLARVGLGSVAQAVAQRCRRQLFLVPPRHAES
jgi:nucleotide-binding universal stress UspA family protein